MARSIENRLRRLEPTEPPSPRQTHRVIVEVGESEDKAIRQHFGEAGPPDRANLFLRQIVEPAPRPTPPAPDPEPPCRPEGPQMSEPAMLLGGSRRSRFG